MDHRSLEDSSVPSPLWTLFPDDSFTLTVEEMLVQKAQGKYEWISLSGFPSLKCYHYSISLWEMQIKQTSRQKKNPEEQYNVF